MGTISATTAGGVTSTTTITITISPATLSGAQAYGWGLNTSGQLGNNSTTSSSVPVAVSSTGVLAGKTIVATASGAVFSLALDSTGAVYAWGSNSAGQLGNNSTTSSSVPVAVNTSGVLAGKTIVGISAANGFALAVSADGKVFSWGANSSGQLGDGTTTNSSVPEQVGGILSTKTIIAVSAGAGFSMALANDGTVYTWGANTNGDLGNNSTTLSMVPVAVSTFGALSGKTVVGIAGANGYALALASDGTVYGWGTGNLGQLGNGGTSNSSVPVAVSTGAGSALNGKTVVAIATASSTSAALASDGTVATWGNGAGGQLGTGSSPSSSLVPVAVATSGVLSGKKVVAIGGGNSSFVVLGSDAAAYTWGNGVNGLLGNNSTTTSNSPVAVDVSAAHGSALAGGQVIGVNSDQLGQSQLVIAKVSVLAPVITSSLTASGTYNSAFSYTITATNTPTNFNATSLPAGLSINTSTGVISGTAGAAGTFTVPISASNVAGTDNKNLVITIAKAAATVTLANSTQTYTGSSITVTGSTTPVARFRCWLISTSTTCRTA